MGSLEEQFQAACDAREIPGVVLVASGAGGKFQYQKAFGQKSPTEDMHLDTTFIMASCTKIMTSIAALQCVERGQIALDDDLSPVIPEFKDIEVLTGFTDAGEPILKRAENKITMRHLLTHTSGFAAQHIHPLIGRWYKTHGAAYQASRGVTDQTPVLAVSTQPLAFEPGTGWAYGPSTNWAGIAVQRLNDMSLEAYMQKHIWDPLGIQDMTFHQELKPAVRAKLAKLSKRGDLGIREAGIRTEEKVQWTDELVYADPTPDELGAGGIIGSATEYIKVLDSICNDDGKLLTSETIDEMAAQQLDEVTQPLFDAFVGYHSANKMFFGREPDAKLGHGLAGLVILEDTETGAKRGTLSWCGMTTLQWTVDRESGLSLMYASNLMPFGDQKSRTMWDLFEREMIKRYAEREA